MSSTGDAPGSKKSPAAGSVAVQSVNPLTGATSAHGFMRVQSMVVEKAGRVRGWLPLYLQRHGAVVSHVEVRSGSRGRVLKQGQAL